MQFPSFLEFLEEQLLIVGKGARYGQVIFLSGGAGSGKGFVINNLLEGDKFKVMDVDEWKRMFQKVDELKKKYPEIRGLDLRKPKDVFKLHAFVDSKGIKEKYYQAIFGQNRNKELLPNIIFDMTAKNVKSIEKVIPLLEAAGYKANKIHMVWVLTDYRIAVKQNKGRARIVPDDILLQTHEGAATTMYKILNGKLPKGLNGGIYVVMGGKDAAVKKDKQKTLPDGTKIVYTQTEMEYFMVKKAGKPLQWNDKLAKLVLFNKIVSKIPWSGGTKEIVDSMYTTE